MSAWALWLLCGVMIIVPLMTRVYLLAPRRKLRTVDELALTPSEVAMLVDDERAVLTALAQLRATGVIDKRRQVRPLTATDRSKLDDLAVQVHTNYSSLTSPRLITVTAASADALSELRVKLEDKQLIVNDRLRRVLRLTTMLLWVAAVGIMSDASFPDHGVYALILFVALGALALRAADKLFRDMRLNKNSKRVLERARTVNKYLNPSNRPALSSYGPAAAGFSTALYGGASVWLLDASFAQAMGVPRRNPTPLNGGRGDGTGSQGSGHGGSDSGESGGDSGGGGCGGGGS